MKRIIETPWGPSQHQHEHAVGIMFHSTASHGGYHLAANRYAQFCEIPEFAQFGEWLEEDCEASLVYLRWPELATDEQIHDAVAMARTVASWNKGQGRWAFIVKWLDDLQSIILERAANHAKSVANLWQRGSMSTTGQQGTWCVSFRRGDNYRTVYMDYPEKRYYTDAELDALDAMNQSEPPSNRSPFPRHSFVGNSYDISPSDADPGL